MPLLNNAPKEHWGKRNVHSHPSGGRNKAQYSKLRTHLHTSAFFVFIFLLHALWGVFTSLSRKDGQCLCSWIAHNGGWRGDKDRMEKDRIWSMEVRKDNLEDWRSGPLGKFFNHTDVDQERFLCAINWLSSSLNYFSDKLVHPSAAHPLPALSQRMDGSLGGNDDESWKKGVRGGGRITRKGTSRGIKGRCIWDCNHYCGAAGETNSDPSW